MPFLLQLRGPSPGKSFPVWQQCVVGRNPDCDVVVPHDSVSRHHARILSTGEYYVVEDLHSRNGTALNNIVIQGRCRLSDGDTLRLSNVEFTFHEAWEYKRGSIADTETCEHIEGAEPHLGTVELTLDMRPRFDVSRFGTTAHAKLYALLDIAQSLGQCFSLETICSRAVDCLFSMMPRAEACCIVLQDEQQDLRPVWSKVNSPRCVEPRLSRKLSQEAMHGKKAILSREARHDPRFWRGESVTQFQIRSIMCAPLVDDNGDAFGVIQVEMGAMERGFHQEELELLMGVATQTALAITLARLHEKELKRRMMERDLELAASVQRELLPKQAPDMPGYEFAHFYRPAETVGGDYFDYLPTPSGRVAVIVADVAGHGIAAALSMSKLSAEVRLLVATLESPAQILTTLNENMWLQRLDARFITLLIAMVNPQQHTINLACAGHMPPILRRTSGVLLEPGRDGYGPPLGVVMKITYVEHQFAVEPGDALALYTDGITEASNPTGQMYGTDQLRKQIAGAGRPVEIQQQVISDLITFMGEQPQADDICLVCLARTV